MNGEDPDPNLMIIWQVELTLLDSRFTNGQQFAVTGRGISPEQAKENALKEVANMEVNLLRLKAIEPS